MRRLRDTEVAPLSTPVDALLAEVLRKILTVHHSLGSDLTVNATVALTDEEWEAIWQTLNEIEGEENAMLSLPEADS